MTTVSFRPGKTCRAWLVVAIVCTLNLQAADEAASYVLQNPSAKELAEPVGLADWPALAQALKAGKATQGRIVSFRELWLAKPGELSQPLSISGVVLRRFRRDPVGQFPALEELWLRTDDDNLVLVTNRARARDSEQVDTTAPGSAVAIVATFIRNVRYDATDEPRVAPWLVASSVMALGSQLQESPDVTGMATSRSNNDLWLVLLGVITTSALLRVVLLYARRSRTQQR